VPHNVQQNQHRHGDADDGDCQIHHPEVGLRLILLGVDLDGAARLAQSQV
jgi:hypothetical protein